MKGDSIENALGIIFGSALPGCWQRRELFYADGSVRDRMDFISGHVCPQVRPQHYIVIAGIGPTERDKVQQTEIAQRGVGGGKTGLAKGSSNAGLAAYTFCSAANR